MADDLNFISLVKIRKWYLSTKRFSTQERWRRRLVQSVSTEILDWKDKTCRWHHLLADWTLRACMQEVKNGYEPILGCSCPKCVYIEKVITNLKKVGHYWPSFLVFFQVLIWLLFALQVTTRHIQRKLP